MAQELGIPFGVVKTALASFQGIARRFEIIRESPVTIVDDYGHHPVEIRATLQAARQLWKKRRIWVLFQPHRYSRTKLLLREFARCFGEADRILVTDIYPAGEAPIRGVSGERLAEEIRGASFTPDHASLLETVRRGIRPGDVVLTQGAGDIWKTGLGLLARLTPTA